MVLNFAELGPQKQTEKTNMDVADVRVEAMLRPFRQLRGFLDQQGGGGNDARDLECVVGGTIEWVSGKTSIGYEVILHLVPPGTVNMQLYLLAPSSSNQIGSHPSHLASSDDGDNDDDDTHVQACSNYSQSCSLAFEQLVRKIAECVGGTAKILFTNFSEKNP